MKLLCRLQPASADLTYLNLAPLTFLGIFSLCVLFTPITKATTTFSAAENLEKFQASNCRARPINEEAFQMGIAHGDHSFDGNEIGLPSFLLPTGMVGCAALMREIIVLTESNVFTQMNSSETLELNRRAESGDELSRQAFDFVRRYGRAYSGEWMAQMRDADGVFHSCRIYPKPNRGLVSPGSIPRGGLFLLGPDGFFPNPERRAYNESRFVIECPQG